MLKSIGKPQPAFQPYNFRVDDFMYEQATGTVASPLTAIKPSTTTITEVTTGRKIRLEA